jgi:anti-sigma B factor antagonist
MAHSRAAAVEGRLPMFGLNRRSLELLVLTKLSTVFELFDNELDAINSCFPGRAVRHFDILEFIQRNAKA